MSDSPFPNGKRRASRRLRFVVGGAIIVAVIAWLVLSNVLGSTTPYLEVTEVKAAGPSERLVRAVGVARAIEWDPQAMLLRFEIADDEEMLAVEYEGVRPDLLVDGTRTVVEGRYSTSGIFQATKVLLKCPSKYEEE
jgi:cytochrome c-type biogenesis protein CcmE